MSIAPLVPRLQFPAQPHTPDAPSPHGPLSESSPQPSGSAYLTSMKSDNDNWDEIEGEIARVQNDISALEAAKRNPLEVEQADLGEGRKSCAPQKHGNDNHVDLAIPTPNPKPADLQTGSADSAVQLLAVESSTLQIQIEQPRTGADFSAEQQTKRPLEVTAQAESNSGLALGAVSTDLSLGTAEQRQRDAESDNNSFISESVHPRNPRDNESSIAEAIEDAATHEVVPHSTEVSFSELLPDYGSLSSYMALTSAQAAARDVEVQRLKGVAPAFGLPPVFEVAGGSTLSLTASDARDQNGDCIRDDTASSASDALAVSSTLICQPVRPSADHTPTFYYSRDPSPSSSEHVSPRSSRRDSPRSAARGLASLSHPVTQASAESAVALTESAAGLDNSVPPQQPPPMLTPVGGVVPSGSPVPKPSAFVLCAPPPNGTVSPVPAVDDVAEMWRQQYLALEAKHKALEVLHIQSQEVEQELENEVLEYERELASAQNHMLLAVTELKQGKEQMNRFMEEKRVLSEHATDAEALLEKMAAHSKQMQSRYEKRIAELSHTMENTDRGFQKANNEITTLSRRMDDLKAQLTEARGELRKLEDENDKLHNKNRIEKGYHDIFEEKYRAAEERCAMLESDLIEAHNEKAEAVRRLKEEIPYEKMKHLIRQSSEVHRFQEAIQSVHPREQNSVMAAHARTVDEIRPVSSTLPLLDGDIMAAAGAPVSTAPPTVAEVLLRRASLNPHTMPFAPPDSLPPSLVRRPAHSAAIFSEATKNLTTHGRRSGAYAAAAEAHQSHYGRGATSHPSSSPRSSLELSTAILLNQQTSFSEKLGVARMPTQGQSHGVTSHSFAHAGSSVDLSSAMLLCRQSGFAEKPGVARMSTSSHASASAAAAAPAHSSPNLSLAGQSGMVPVMTERITEDPYTGFVVRELVPVQMPFILESEAAQGGGEAEADGSSSNDDLLDTPRSDVASTVRENELSDSIEPSLSRSVGASVTEASLLPKATIISSDTTSTPSSTNIKPLPASHRRCCSCAGGSNEMRSECIIC